MFHWLAGAAAQAIFFRCVLAVGGVPTAEAVAATSDEALCAAGLSANKLASLRDLGGKVLGGTIVLRDSSRRGDGAITVRAIGRRTAEMYLMFELRRLDV